MTGPGRTLLVRADASIATGCGHVMRCIALAQAWCDIGGRCLFLMAESTPTLDDRLCRERLPVKFINAKPGDASDIRLTQAAALNCGASWIAIDGYRFGTDYQRALKDAGFSVLCIDDYGHAEEYFADLLLNQNPYANATDYARCGPNTGLLLGPRYALLRKEFSNRRRLRREVAPDGRKILVTMGGSDPDNVTLMVIEALSQVQPSEIEVTVVLGGSNPHSLVIERRIEKLDYSIRLVKDATNMPVLMADADIAISGAGTTYAELCFMGLPSILIDVAENQRRIAQSLSELGTALYLGSSKSVTAEAVASQTKNLLSSRTLREQMSKAAAALVDGEGTARVVTLLVERAIAAGREHSCPA